jgi:hypothetical protein
VNYYGGYAKKLAPRARARVYGIHARTPKVCSCWMCGNPRRYWGSGEWRLTVQEIKARQAFADAVQDLQQ